MDEDTQSTDDEDTDAEPDKLLPVKIENGISYKKGAYSRYEQINRRDIVTWTPIPGSIVIPPSQKCTVPRNLYPSLFRRLCQLLLATTTQISNELWSELSYIAKMK